MKKIYFFLIVIITIFFCSCVYYNTFFNARKYYFQALSQKKDNNNNVTTSIKNNFDKSIAKCAYIIKEYPKSRWIDNALLLMGKCFYEQEEYFKALKKFQEIEKYYNTSSLYPEAKLYLAKTYLRLKEKDKAVREYNIIFNNKRFTKIRETAYLDYHNYYIEEENYNQALNIINQLMETSPSKKNKDIANFLYAKNLYLKKDYENALHEFLRFISTKPSKSMKLDAQYLLGKTYIELEEFEKAHKLFYTIEKDEFRKDKINLIKINIAICKANFENFEESFTLLEDIINNSNATTASLANYYWGNIYFYIQHDFSKAKEKFDKVNKKNLNEKILEKINKESKIVEDFIKYQDLKNSDKYFELAKKQFQIAEYYNLDLSKPDSAIAIYDEIKIKYDFFKSKLDSLNDSLNYISDTTETALFESKSGYNDSLGYLEIDSTGIVSTIIISDTLSNTKLVIKDSVSETVSPTSKDSAASIDSTIITTEKIKDTISIEKSLAIQNNNNIQLHDSVKTLRDTIFTVIKDNSKIDDTLTSTVIDSDLTIIDTSSISITDSTYLPDSTKTAGKIDTSLVKQDSLQKSQNIKIIKKQLQNKIKELENLITNYKNEIYNKALFMQVWTYLTIKKDTVEAQKIIKQLTREFSESKYTKAAQKIVNNEKYEYLFKHNSEAKIIYDESLNYYYDENNIEKSMSYLDSIIYNYQDDSIYQDALYFKSFILINNYQDTTSAKPYLKELLENYPDYEMIKRINKYFDGDNYILPVFEEETTNKNDK